MVMSVIQGESRKRSIYEALVYTADVNVSGDFKRPDIAKLSSHIAIFFKP